ncbi:hypothetical protein GLOTRDRAFT_44707 [Gloeophyllum trabeum ATCC 11539]|uniref:Uncharacterized protein n=1 Tax=Gloeophyllum trabeum (strain ATCC 11539 / FP-39264 / Madison 617) TaxID=670483 RepID=S7Q1U6_GLOTA|nr:uncharacterized protein GLOTRDRAFT_44707 [Gloeophyllum trabeum ATCC 11539]EPQ53488.1 hypothetical protein GLOTRDRAFT_44707 [Gloeophyllum trabeum ATCC 11539]
MPRTLYLAIFHRHLFPAHWVIYKPNTDDTSSPGTMLHVEGDVANGFSHTVARNYDILKTSRTYTMITLGQVDSQYVKDYPKGAYVSLAPVQAIDRVEQVILSVPAPGKSLRIGELVKQSNCQDWVKECVKALINLGMQRVGRSSLH